MRTDALTTIALDSDVLGLILAEFTTAAPAICVCKRWAEVARPVVHAKNPLNSLAGDEKITQGNLEAALLLPADVVRSMPYGVRRRHGGGEYHIFEMEPAVNGLLARTGWLAGLAVRMVLKERRAARKRSITALDVDDARVRLARGLAVLGLEIRADSTMCREFVESAGRKHGLETVLTTAARMHWLHHHTNGSYLQAVELAVDELAEERNYRCSRWRDDDSESDGGGRTFYTGIHRDAADIVQSRARFRLPVDGLPWLPASSGATATALGAALDAAAPEGAAKRSKRNDLAARRSAALAERRAAFAEARASAVHVRTEADLRALVPASELGNVFDLVLKSSPTVASVCTLAAELEAKCAARASRVAAFVEARASAVHVKKLHDLPAGVIGDFNVLTEAPKTTLSELLAAADAIETEQSAQREMQKEIATTKGGCERACTRPGCKNKHRATNPFICESGPICGACEKSACAIR